MGGIDVGCYVNPKKIVYVDGGHMWVSLAQEDQYKLQAYVSRC